jgi:anti-sigma B factor antagonist
MATEPVFSYEVAKSQDDLGNKVTTINCRGRLVSENGGQMKDLIKPLIAEGGRIVIDLGELSYLDSSGLGALVGLKVSALNKGLCRLELVNLTPRVKELLSLANLTKLFAS